MEIIENSIIKNSMNKTFSFDGLMFEDTTIGDSHPKNNISNSTLPDINNYNPRSYYYKSSLNPIDEEDSKAGESDSHGTKSNNSKKNPFINTSLKTPMTFDHTTILKDTRMLNKAPEFSLNREIYSGSPDLVLVTKSQEFNDFPIKSCTLNINRDTKCNYMKRQTLEIKEKLLNLENTHKNTQSNENLIKENELNDNPCRNAGKGNEGCCTII